MRNDPFYSYFVAHLAGDKKHIKPVAWRCISLEIRSQLVSCSTELSMKVIMLINVKMPTLVGILTILA